MSTRDITRSTYLCPHAIFQGLLKGLLKFPDQSLIIHFRVFDLDEFISESQDFSLQGGRVLFQLDIVGFACSESFHEGLLVFLVVRARGNLVYP